MCIEDLYKIELNKIKEELDLIKKENNSFLVKIQIVICYYLIFRIKKNNKILEYKIKKMVKENERK